MYPDVPHEHRALLEPHLKGAQGRVTQLEQQYAPFKEFIDSGMDPQTAGNLLKFSATFEQDPLGTWVRMGRMLQQPGQQGQPPVIDPELDVDYLEALARGEDPDAGLMDTAMGQGQPGQAGTPANGQVDPEFAQYVRGLEEQVQQLTQRYETDARTRHETVTNQLFERSLNRIREAVKQSGWPEELLTDREIGAKLIVNNGNVQQTITDLTNTRTGLLKGFTDKKEPAADGVTMPNGAPPTTPKPKPAKDSWGRARQGATVRLRRNNIADAQSS
jgi:hypothetical protein